MSRWFMAKAVQRIKRREEALSRDHIIEAAISLLDSNGEAGLTFRILSERLATGPGAIYGYIANKSDLLTASCDAIVAHTVETCIVGDTPKKRIRSLALGIFDVIDAHPWVGSALLRAELDSPLVRILEPIGQQVRALGVPGKQQWASVAALMSYILGVAGQNAANGQHARLRGIDRSGFLEAMSKAWLQLDPQRYPFTRSVAKQLPAHDDRLDFLAGVDLILKGIDSQRRLKRPRR